MLSFHIYLCRYLPTCAACLHPSMHTYLPSIHINTYLDHKIGYLCQTFQPLSHIFQRVHTLYLYTHKPSQVCWKPVVLGICDELCISSNHLPLKLFIFDPIFLKKACLHKKPVAFAGFMNSNLGYAVMDQVSDEWYLDSLIYLLGNAWSMAHYISVLTTHRFDCRETSQPRVLIVKIAEGLQCRSRACTKGVLQYRPKPYINHSQRSMVFQRNMDFPRTL